MAASSASRRVSSSSLEGKMMTSGPLGPICVNDADCRVERSACTPLGFCQCDVGLFFDRDLTACVPLMEYNQACIPSLVDQCRNDNMFCSDSGLCKCETGFTYSPGWTPFCHPSGNTSACPVGQVWSDIRSQCISRPVDVWVESGAYDRNRYSLFFAVLLILLLMVILFKSKKPHPSPFPYGGTAGAAAGAATRAASQHSCPDAYDPDVLSIDELDIRLAEAGLYRDPRPRHHHHLPHRITNLGEGSDGFCVTFQPPPPSYSSTLNLSRASVDRREKPPPYEEAIRLSPATPVLQNQADPSSVASVVVSEALEVTSSLESNGTPTTPAAVITAAADASVSCCGEGLPNERKEEESSSSTEAAAAAAHIRG